MILFLIMYPLILVSVFVWTLCNFTCVVANCLVLTSNLEGYAGIARCKNHSKTKVGQ